MNHNRCWAKDRGAVFGLGPFFFTSFASRARCSCSERPASRPAISLFIGLSLLLGGQSQDGFGIGLCHIRAEEERVVFSVLPLLEHIFPMRVEDLTALPGGEDCY